MSNEKDTPNRATFSWRWVLTAIFALAIIGLIFANPSHTFHGIPIEPIEPAPDFTLTNYDLQSVSLKDYRGQFVLLYFGFTNCPDECPITMAEWRRVYEILDTDASQVEFLFISVDPDRDTPERLKEYLSFFNPNIVGLTGSLDDLEDIARSYSAFFVEIPITSSAPTPTEEHSHDDMDHDDMDMEDGESHDDMDMQDGESHDHSDLYLVDHTTMIHLIDREGNLLRVYPYYETAETLAEDLVYLLKQ